MDLRALLCEDENARDEIKEIFVEIKKEFSSKNDRGVAIISASMIDFLVEDLLDAFFVDFESKNARKRIFSNSGVLANLSSKIEMSFALGLLSEWDRNLLIKIVSIRNKIAHKIIDANFNSEDIINQCKALVIPDDLLLSMDINDKKDGKYILYKPGKNDHRGWFQTATYVAISIISTRKLQITYSKRSTPNDFTHRSDFAELNLKLNNILIKEAKDVLKKRDEYKLTDEKVNRFTYMLNNLKERSLYLEADFASSDQVIIIEGDNSD